MTKNQQIAGWQDKILFTPGPLTTSRLWGWSRGDADRG